MHRSFPPNTPFGVLLRNLHTAKRHLLVQIETTRHTGKSTTQLEHQLATKDAESRAFVAYLKGAHA